MDTKGKRFYVNRREEKVYGLEDFENFCSVACKRRCFTYQLGLSDEPAWAEIEKKKDNKDKHNEETKHHIKPMSE